MLPDNIFVKLDFSYAFNCRHRDFMLERANEVVPELYKCCHLAHSHHSMLQFGNFGISSEERPQLGDPLGGLIFFAWPYIQSYVLLPLPLRWVSWTTFHLWFSVHRILRRRPFSWGGSQNTPSTQCRQMRDYFQGPVGTRRIPCWLFHITSGSRHSPGRSTGWSWFSHRSRRRSQVFRPTYSQR